jgi:transcriptional antiterminator RfaH
LAGFRLAVGCVVYIRIANRQPANCQPTNYPVKMLNHLDKKEPRWFAVYTHSRCEKKVEHYLKQKQINAYLPLGRKLQRWGRVARKVEKPLINGYVFVKIVQKEYVPVLETTDVAGFLKLGRELLSIPEEQMELLRRLAGEEDLEIETLESKSLELGASVEIISGNLAGVKGKLIAIQGKQKVVVELVNFAFDLILTIDKSMLMESEEI